MNEYGFIGAGKMAGAIVQGMIASGAASASSIACVCGADSTGAELAKSTGIILEESIEKLCGNSKTVVLACKPQQLAALSEKAASAKIELLISILAGTSVARLRQKFPNVRRIVRVMPNMPAQISQGISCYASEGELTEAEESKVLGVLSAIGEVSKVQESELDAVTAVSGSGPGYVFEFAAAMIASAVKLGFTEAVAEKLVIKTLLGSAMLLEKSPLPAEKLRDAVCSPGGTTLAALAEFEKAGFRKTFDEALAAAQRRSKELSKL